MSNYARGHRSLETVAYHPRAWSDRTPIWMTSL